MRVSFCLSAPTHLPRQLRQHRRIVSHLLPVGVDVVADLAVELRVFGCAEEPSVRSGFHDVELRRNPRRPQCTVHTDRVGEEEVARPRSQDRGGKALAEVTEEGETYGSVRSWPAA